jgi:hypothetical protein
MARQANFPGRIIALAARQGACHQSNMTCPALARLGRPRWSRGKDELQESERAGHRAGTGVNRRLSGWFQKSDAPTSREAGQQLASLLAADRFRARVALTCRGKAEDGPERAHAVLAAMLLAKTAGCRYLHTPAARPGGWEAFLNLGHGEATVPVEAELVPLADFEAAPGRYEGRAIIVHAPDFRPLMADNPDAYETIAPHLRLKYLATDRSALPLHHADPAAFAVALQPAAHDAGAERWAEDDAAFHATLQQVRDAAARLSQPLELHLYADGPAEAFAAFRDAGCTLHLGGDPFEAFHNLVMAQVLATSAGALGFLAGLLADGIVLCGRTDPRPLSRWITRNPEGAVSARRLQVAMQDRRTALLGTGSLGHKGRWRAGGVEVHADAVRLGELIRIGRVPPDLAVTCRRFDGAGGQAAGALSAMAFAHKMGCRYLHSPFGTTAHAIGEREDWGRRWEEFFNIGEGETAVPPDATLVSVPELLSDPDRYAQQPIVAYAPEFDPPPWRSRVVAADRPRTLWPKLRARYCGADKSAIPLHSEPGRLTVAVHVRRGDVTPVDNFRFVPDAATLAAIARLRQVLEPLGPLRLNLYSEGQAETFGGFAALGCHLYLDTDPFETFHNFVTADILIMPPSAFSGFAAMLSTGVVLARIRCPDPRWVYLRRDGLFHRAALRRAVLSGLGWRQRALYHLRRHLQSAPQT